MLVISQSSTDDGSREAVHTMNSRENGGSQVEHQLAAACEALTAQQYDFAEIFGFNQRFSERNIAFF